MDQQMMQQVIGWVQGNVGERTSKQELMRKSEGADLPQEAKAAFQELPEGEHSKQDVVSMLREKMMASVGGGMGGGAFGDVMGRFDQGGG